MGNGWVSAPEFWRMSPGQLWWMVGAKMPQEARDRPSHNARLYDLLKKSKGAANG